MSPPSQAAKKRMEVAQWGTARGAAAGEAKIHTMFEVDVMLYIILYNNSMYIYIYTMYYVGQPGVFCVIFG